MEAAPPSYESAITTSHWDFVAQYLSASDLCSAALVCRKWYRTFLPQLWGNPASHFGLANDAVYVALTRFKWTLHWAGIDARRLTHTLRLPPAHAQAYDGPNADWLRTTLESLPRLQSLIVHGIPFFDHASLLALRKQNPSNMLYELRLLDASNCKNATPNGLAEVIQRLPALVYLDLSWTLPAKDPFVISKLRYLRGLRILKLRGLSLKDEDIKIIAKAIGLKVRSLDVRNNRFSDSGVRALLDSCILGTDDRLALEQRPCAEDGPRTSDGLPPYVKEKLAGIFQSEQFEEYLYKALSEGFITRLALEDAMDVGLTHLYLADNLVTVSGLRELIESAKLYVLDVGNPVVSTRTTKAGSNSRNESDQTSPTFLDMETLAHPLATHASPDITYLRINHTVITKDSPLGLETRRTAGLSATISNLETLPPYVESTSKSEITDAHRTQSGSSEFDTTPVYPSNLSVTGATAGPLGSLFKSVMALSVGDELEAQEKYENDLQNLHISRISSQSSGSKDKYTSSEEVSGPSDRPDLSNAQHSAETYKRVYSCIVDERHRRLEIARSTSRHLHPATLPKLRTLVLTGIPSHTFSKELSDRIIAFICECAEETCLSNLLARVDYSIPPGLRKKASYLREYAKSVFSLNRIVLELEHSIEHPTLRVRRGSKGWNYQYSTKSVTEDADSEALWTAGEEDFSFFVNEDETNSDFETVPPNGKESKSYRCDTAAELIAYRKASRQKYEAMKHRDECSIHGYWNGKVEIVRPSTKLK